METLRFPTFKLNVAAAGSVVYFWSGLFHFSPAGGLQSLRDEDEVSAGRKSHSRRHEEPSSHQCVGLDFLQQKKIILKFMSRNLVTYFQPSQEDFTFGSVAR